MSTWLRQRLKRPPSERPARETVSTGRPARAGHEISSRPQGADGLGAPSPWTDTPWRSSSWA
eukprot:980640-Pyramimonas_sp.AAC.1